MPRTSPPLGSAVCSADTQLYTRRHGPWTDFSNLDHTNERPYADLPLDLAQGALPSLAFVIPNNIDNMDDGTIDQGDAWLSRNIPAMLGALGKGACSCSPGTRTTAAAPIRS